MHEIAFHSHIMLGYSGHRGTVDMFSLFAKLMFWRFFLHTSKDDNSVVIHFKGNNYAANEI